MNFSPSGLVKSVITNLHPPMPPEMKKLIFREGPGERLAEFLGDRPGCCLKLGGQAVTILLFLEINSDKHQGFCGQLATWGSNLTPALTVQVTLIHVSAPSLLNGK